MATAKCNIIKYRKLRYNYNAITFLKLKIILKCGIALTATKINPKVNINQASFPLIAGL